MGVRGKTRWRVFRLTETSDGAGGAVIEYVEVGVARGDVRELVGRERVEAMQAGAEQTHVGFFHTSHDIIRNDELRRDSLTLKVLDVTPAFPPGIGRNRILARSTEAGS